MIFEGHVLAYNPSTNEAGWIPVCSTTSDLSGVEGVSTLALCNLVLCIPDEGASRLDQFGEHRDAEGGVGEASPTEVPREEGLGEESMHEDEPEDADDEDVDDEDTDNASASSSASSQESQHSTCHYSDRHCHPRSWAEHWKSEDGEDDLWDSPQASVVEVRGRVNHQPVHPPHLVFKSPPVSQQRQPLERQHPLPVMLCLPVIRMQWSST